MALYLVTDKRFGKSRVMLVESSLGAFWACVKVWWYFKRHGDSYEKDVEAVRQWWGGPSGGGMGS